MQNLQKTVKPERVFINGLVTKDTHHSHFKVVRLEKDPVRCVLIDFGLTEKEVTTYVFLAKHGPMKGGEIAKLTKTQKAQTYRMLKSLQSKGLVETTLESPARFAAVQFEKFIDLNIKTKQEEALLLEKTKSELLEHWRKTDTRSFGSELEIEKFAAIEGKQKIYPKIAQMVREAKDRFSAMINIDELARADRYGLFESVFEHPQKSNIQFRFVVDLNEKNLQTTKALLNVIPKIHINIKSKREDTDLRFSPRIVIRDNEEILFFITPRNLLNVPDQNEVCLWTNCHELVQAFSTAFEDAWQNSADIDRAISDIETAAVPPIPNIRDANYARKKYGETIAAAEKEITILTSSKGLIAYANKDFLPRKAAKGKISVKLMAPITNYNLKAAEELSKFSEVRHVPPNYLQITIVDGKHLFQFGELAKYRWDAQSRVDPIQSLDFENIRYSDNSISVTKMRSLLEDVWKDSIVPSKTTLDSILGTETAVLQTPKSFSSISAQTPQIGLPTHCSAQAVIHMPAHLNIPDMLIDITHFGEPNDEKANWISIATWLKTPKGYAFIPTAIVLSRGHNDPMATTIENANKAIFAGTPAAQNVVVVSEHALQVWMQKNTLFVGWTMPITVLPHKYFLPPAFLLFEGYGGSTHLRRTISNLPSGYRVMIEMDGVEAFATFMSPSLRYTGPGTEGRVYTTGLIKIANPQSHSAG
jgi:sugar-specific transcriptional regulator TrmB